MVMFKRDDAIIIGESKVDHDGRVATPPKRWMSQHPQVKDVIWNQDHYSEVDQKGLKTIKVFKGTEYDTHQKVIL